MTKREAAVVMAYTGYAMLTGEDLDIYHQYVERKLGRPVSAHELYTIEGEIQKAAKMDFKEICESLT